MSNTANSQPYLFPPSSAETRRALELEIAQLTGERYTCEDRLAWLNKRISELQAALHNFTTY